MKFSFRNTTSTKPGLLPVVRGNHEVPKYLSHIIAGIEQNWEPVDPEQLDHALERFMAANLVPIERLESELEKQNLELRSILYRMVELAPDLFDNALRHTTWETGYLIAGDKDYE